MKSESCPLPFGSLSYYRQLAMQVRSDVMLDRLIG